MKAEAISASIRGHIIAASPPDKRELQFTDSSSLVASGILDSLAVFSLVAFLEQRYGIEVADEELVWDTFATVEAITRLVESKLESLPRAPR